MKNFVKRLLQVQSLYIPTSNATATKYHSNRVYLQVQEWTRWAGLNPTEWGWQLNDGNLIPVQMDLPPAQPELLNVIRCNCKIGCASVRCSCRKNGLQFTLTCKEYRGASCANAQQPDFDNVLEKIELKAKDNLMTRQISMRILQFQTCTVCLI